MPLIGVDNTPAGGAGNPTFAQRNGQPLGGIRVELDGLTAGG